LVFGHGNSVQNRSAVATNVATRCPCSLSHRGDDLVSRNEILRPEIDELAREIRLTRCAAERPRDVASAAGPPPGRVDSEKQFGDSAVCPVDVFLSQSGNLLI
jgi:hypothetical protein